MYVLLNNYSTANCTEEQTYFQLPTKNLVVFSVFYGVNDNTLSDQYQVICLNKQISPNPFIKLLISYTNDKVSTKADSI